MTRGWQGEETYGVCVPGAATKKAKNKTKNKLKIKKNQLIKFVD